MQWKRKVEGSALGIAGIYAGVAMLWITFSDQVVAALDAQEWQTAKGGVFVLVTAGLLFVLMRRSLAERAIQQEKLGQALRDQQIMLAHLNHDLRQPTQALALFVSCLPSDTDGRVSQGIQRSLARLGSVLEAQRTLALLELELASVRADEVDVAALVSSVVDAHQPEATARGLELRKHLRPATSRCDPFVLSSMLGSLLANALRYTDQGGVLVCLRQRHGRTQILIHDTGPGIPSQRLEELFQPFVQGDNPGRNSNDGLGLGLTLSRHWARLLNAELTLRSRVGHGTTALITLPKSGT